MPPAPAAAVPPHENQPRPAAQDLGGGGPGESADRTEGGAGGRRSGAGPGDLRAEAGGGASQRATSGGAAHSEPRGGGVCSATITCGGELTRGEYQIISQAFGLSDLLQAWIDNQHEWLYTQVVAVTSLDGAICRQMCRYGSQRNLMGSVVQLGNLRSQGWYHKEQNKNKTQLLTKVN